MNLKWTTQSLWFYIFSHTNCLVKPLHFTQMLYSHAIRPWIHSSSACIELNMLSIDLPVSREQTRGHVKVSVCVWEGEGDEKGPGRVSKSKEWERKERESSVCILDQWESERHCSSFRNTLWSNRFLPSAAFTCVFISSWFSRYSELYISPVLAAFAQEASLTSLTKKRLYSSNVTPVLQHWSEQRCPELSLLRNFLQFSQTIPRCSQSQLRDISSPVCPGFPISWMYLKKVPKKHHISRWRSRAQDLHQEVLIIPIQKKKSLNSTSVIIFGFACLSQHDTRYSSHAWMF